MASRLRLGVLGPGYAIVTMEQGKLREKKATLSLRCRARQVQVDQGRGEVKWDGGDQAGCAWVIQVGILHS